MTWQSFVTNGTVRAVCTALGCALITAALMALPPIAEVLKAGTWPTVAAWSATAASFAGFFVSAMLTALSMLRGNKFSGSFTS